MPLSDFFEGFEGWTPVNNPAGAPPPPNTSNPGPSQAPSSAEPSNSPYLRTTLPLPLQYTNDTLKQNNRQGLSTFRMAPLPPGGAPTLNSASNSSAVPAARIQTIEVVETVLPGVTSTGGVNPATLNNVADSPSRYGQTASGLSYRPLTNPLTATDAGSNATISIASFTMRTSSKGDISISSGSITALSYSTLYYVYYDDPNLGGGAVTFHATTTQSTSLEGVGRFYVGSILTPPSGGSSVTGNNDGGVGAQIGALSKVFFSTMSKSTSTPEATITNPTNGFDGSDATFTALKVTPSGGSGGETIYTVSLPMTSVYAFLTANLMVKTAVPTNGASTTICTLAYSLDGGTTWTNIYSLPGTNTRALTVDSVSLSSPLNLGSIQVQATIESSGTGGNQELDFYEAWLVIVS